MTALQEARARDRFAATAAVIATEREALKSRARAAITKLPIDPLALMLTVAEALPADAIVVEETLSSGMGLRELLKSDDPQSFFGLRGGGIGWGLPAAIGVKLALPKRPVVALVGDGSAMYTCQALWTAAHDRVAVVFVIINNKSYRILKQRLTAMQGHAAQTNTYTGMELTNPPIDFLGLARSLGVRAERATTLDAMADLLRGGLVENRPMLIEVETDPSFWPG
jgi:benzoylformate decarboxylase